MDKEPIIITESSAFFSEGQLIEDYKVSEDGVIIGEQLVPLGKYIVINEEMSNSDEKRVKELIKLAFKNFFNNLYTKQAILI